MNGVAITKDEFVLFTFATVPIDFDECAMLAQQIIDAHTMYAYVGREIDTLPSLIQTTYKQAIAMQTLMISQNGGVGGSSESEYTSVSIGKFSYSGDNAASRDGTGQKNEPLSPAAKALLPMLCAYARGLRA